VGLASGDLSAVPTPGTPWINVLVIEPGIARPRPLASGQDVGLLASRINPPHAPKTL
jgi:hypothetical protein